MAVFHIATLTPSKSEIISGWVSSQPWAPSSIDDLTIVGSYRFDDPEGRVGIEGIVADANGVLIHVPLTYRDEPLPDTETALIAQANHSVLGNRWVYDGLGDPLFLTMIAAFTLTGQGEALGMFQRDDRRLIAPSTIRIRGGGWGQERVAVDRFERVTEGETIETFVNDRFELRISRTPTPGPFAPIALTAIFDTSETAIQLAEIRHR